MEKQRVEGGELWGKCFLLQRTCKIASKMLLIITYSRIVFWLMLSVTCIQRKCLNALAADPTSSVLLQLLCQDKTCRPLRWALPCSHEDGQAWARAGRGEKGQAQAAFALHLLPTSQLVHGDLLCAAVWEWQE